MDFFRNFFKKFKDHFIPSERNVYRPHILRKPWLIFFVTVLLTSEGVFLANIVSRQSALDFIAAVLPGEVIALTNVERTANNISPVVENPVLDAAAQAKAADMAAKGYFSHVGPGGKEPWAWITEAGYVYQYAGENLAVRFTGSSDVVNAWMASPTHRANIVKSAYTEIGVGTAEGEFQGQPATYVVQYFGTPRAASVPPTASSPISAIVPVPELAQDSLPHVEGAATSQTPPVAEPDPVPTPTYTEPIQIQIPQQQESPWSSIAKGLLENTSQPNTSVLWILGSIAVIMIIGIALTFFIHIQIQPTELLISGAVVAVIALAFLALNSQTTGTQGSSQSAAVFGALPSEGGFVDSVAATTQN